MNKDRHEDTGYIEPTIGYIAVVILTVFSMASVGIGYGIGGDVGFWMQAIGFGIGSFLGLIGIAWSLFGAVESLCPDHRNQD